MYTAIIGDLIKSREIGDRAVFQKQLKEILDDVNVKYKNQLGSKFSITLGDEFQGLLTEPGGILEIIQYIKFRMHPVSGRFGVGIGEITTPIDPEQSLGADGPAYHRARRMVEYLKKNERGKKTAVGDIRVEAEAGDPCIGVVNSCLTLLTLIESKWTPKQRETIGDTHYHKLTQGEIARKSGLNQSTIHRSLKTSGYFEYLEAVTAINALLGNRYGGKP